MEIYIANYQKESDEVLLSKPDGIFIPLKLFVCTYVAKLTNLNITPTDFTEIIKNNLNMTVIAVNSNFGHGCMEGSEEYVKHPKEKVGLRKRQGDGTCFNSAVEPVISLNPTVVKKYFIKCFPTTGEMQIPGVINQDLSDGHEVLLTFVDYLNTLHLSEFPVEIQWEIPKMLNYKFRLIRNSPRILINLMALATYLYKLELTDLLIMKEITGDIKLLPPFKVKEVKPAIEDIKVSFRFEYNDNSPRINIFQEGKINILGCNSISFANDIYEFFKRLFDEYWKSLVCIKPKKDKEVENGGVTVKRKYVRKTVAN